MIIMTVYIKAIKIIQNKYPSTSTVSKLTINQSISRQNDDQSMFKKLIHKKILKFNYFKFNF